MPRRDGFSVSDIDVTPVFYLPETFRKDVWQVDSFVNYPPDKLLPGGLEVAKVVGYNTARHEVGLQKNSKMGVAIIDRHTT